MREGMGDLAPFRRHRSESRSGPDGAARPASNNLGYTICLPAMIEMYVTVAGDGWLITGKRRLKFLRGCFWGTARDMRTHHPDRVSTTPED